jgi:hypothetical protein
MASMTISLGTVGACALKAKTFGHTPEGIPPSLVCIETGPEQ